MIDSTGDCYPYPVFRVGIVGGGQLGRMLVKAAKQLGCTCLVLDPTPNSPAGQVSGQQIVGDFHDPATLRALAERCDLITCEIEDVDSSILRTLGDEGRAIFPQPEVLAVLQDKLTQKRRFAAAGIPTPDFLPMDRPDPELCQRFGYPLVQKARRGGYDGRGVAVLRAPEDFASHLPVPSLIERFVVAEREIAVMVARGADGDWRCYPPAEMWMHPGENLLDLLLAPARVPAEVAMAAQALALRTVETLGGIGVFGVELFLTASGELLVNEVAPRTHNSGHYTLDACVTDQFEQHLRAIAGLPLGSTEQLSPAAMLNLLGAPGYCGRPIIRGLRAALAIDGVSVYIYGKATTRPYRKMGHATVLDAEIERALNKARRLGALIEIMGEEPC